MKFTYATLLLAVASIVAASPSARIEARKVTVTPTTQDVVDVQGWIEADMDEVLGKRDTNPLKKRNGIICNNVSGSTRAGTYAGLIADANHLVRVAKCSVGAGPRKCIRTACSANTGAWLCNDNTYPITIPCSVVASYIENIYNQCHKVYGQEFYNKFNVILAYSKC